MNTDDNASEKFWKCPSDTTRCWQHSKV